MHKFNYMLVTGLIIRGVGGGFYIKRGFYFSIFTYMRGEKFKKTFEYNAVQYSTSMTVLKTCITGNIKKEIFIAEQLCKLCNTAQVLPQPH